MGADEPSAEILIGWNELVLAAIRESEAKPTIVARTLHIVHNAIYDAWAAYDPVADGVHARLEPMAGHAPEDRLAAVSWAAFTALNDLFGSRPDLVQTFRQRMVELNQDPDLVSADPGSAVGIGQAAAAAVLAFRAVDGANAAGGFADTSGYQPVNSADPEAPNVPGGPDFDPNHWQPLRVPTGAVLDAEGNPIATDDPQSYQDQLFLTPHWGGVAAFALPSGDVLRPPAPPQLGDFSPYTDALGTATTGDAAYRAQFDELVAISAALTPEQKAIAEYWADGPRSETPPGHWNALAQGIALREGYGLGEAVKFFMALNGALFDASVAAWDTKRAYDFIRPQSAIQHLYDDEVISSWAGPGQGTRLILGNDWQPYQDPTFVTPPFAEYVSGHSTFSAAAAEVIESFTGSARFYDGVTRSNRDLDGDGELDLLGSYTVRGLGFEHHDGPPITLAWETVWEAADEAGMSRRYGGIHIQDGDLVGRAMGREVGTIAMAVADDYFSGRAPGLRTPEHTAPGPVALDDRATVLPGGLAIVDVLANDLPASGTPLGQPAIATAPAPGMAFLAQGDRLAWLAPTEAHEAGKVLYTIADRHSAATVTFDVDTAARAVRGTNQRDRLEGGREGELLDGQSGRDILLGRAGDDLLLGGPGQDRLRGGQGQDVLRGGPGHDRLSGGPGADLFVLEDGQGLDVIRDFAADEDRVLLAIPDLLDGDGALRPDAVRLVERSGDLLLLAATADGLAMLACIEGAAGLGPDTLFLNAIAPDPWV